MHKLNEALLQFIWQHKLWKPVAFKTQSGKDIQIVKPGELNTDSGPDFFNACIRIDNLLLVGNIEVHLKTSDWLKHKHQHDTSYDTIILHVVYEHDTELEQNRTYQVEVLELKSLIDSNTISTYRNLISAKDKLACASQLNEVQELKLLNWLERMAMERLEEKTKQLESYFKASDRSYIQTFYIHFLRCFGFKVNALPFELLAKQLPIQLVLKHADNHMQLEALFLGMAGFLDTSSGHKYIQGLRTEFTYLQKKYNLTPLQKKLFKFSRMRPANFPTVRLVQFANLVHQNSTLFVNPHHFSTYSELVKLLRLAPTGYWEQRYTVNGSETGKTWMPGRISVENLIINAFAPFFFFYAKQLNKTEYTTAAIELLHACKFEINTKTKLFYSRKTSLSSSALSQATIHLYDTYCLPRACLKCGIAAAILNPQSKHKTAIS